MKIIIEVGKFDQIYYIFKLRLPCVFKNFLKNLLDCSFKINFIPAEGLFLEVFSTLGMKKLPYLKLGPFGNLIFFPY